MEKSKQTKSKGKSQTKNVKNMSQEELKEALIKKRECDQRALQIVERLLENPVPESSFVYCLRFLNPSHLQDAVEERALLKQCGYPICTKSLGITPRQQYTICTQSNKVFDITERKNFCSNQCYKAFIFIKEQMLSSPLWLRDKEEIPEFKLLTTPTKGFIGAEVDLGTCKLELEATKITQDIHEELINDVVDDINLLETLEKLHLREDNYEKSSLLCSRDKTTEKKSSKSKNISSDNVEAVVKEIKERPSSTRTIQLIDIPPIKHKKETPKDTNISKAQSDLSTVSHVENCIEEWITLKTLIYLNENKIKMLLPEELNITTEPSITETSAYKNLNKKLNLLEMEDYKYDSKITAPSLKPVPTFSSLEKENALLEIKVRSFFQGQLEIDPEAINDTEMKPENSDGSEEIPIVLPLSEKRSQNALRRNILSTTLIKIVPEILAELNFSNFDINLEIRNITVTFFLSAKNILFKPKHYKFLGYFLIKLLSIKYKNLKKVLAAEESQAYEKKVIETFSLPKHYFDDFLNKIFDESFVSNLKNK